MKHLFWIFFWGWAALYAQQPDSLTVLPEPVEATAEGSEMETWEEPDLQPYIPPPAKPIDLRKADQEQWNKAVAGLDYSKDRPRQPKEEKKQTTPDPGPSFNWGGLSSALGQILQVLAIIAAIAGIAYGIYRTMNAPRNRQIARDGVEITLDNVEQYIHESDIERFLREALAAGNYPLAVRLYYLQIIKQLSASGAIRWSREKPTAITSVKPGRIAWLRNSGRLRAFMSASGMAISRSTPRLFNK